MTEMVSCGWCTCLDVRKHILGNIQFKEYKPCHYTGFQVIITPADKASYVFNLWNCTQDFKIFYTKFTPTLLTVNVLYFKHLITVAHNFHH